MILLSLVWFVQHLRQKIRNIPGNYLIFCTVVVIVFKVTLLSLGTTSQQTLYSVYFDLLLQILVHLLWL